MRQDVRGVVGGQKRIDGDRHDAGMDRTQKGDGPFDAVVREEQDALFATQAMLAQDRRELANPGRELAVRHARAIVDVRDAIGMVGIAGDEVLRKVER